MIICPKPGFVSAPDPYVLGLPPPGIFDNMDTNGKTLRSLTINPAIRNLVLLMAGESNFSNLQPTTYIPTNTSVVDNFNVFDGAAYNINGALLGTTIALDQTVFGKGNVCARLADLLVTNGQFDRVILVPLATSTTNVSMWGTPTSTLYNKVNVAMLRLAARGITPATPGVTFTLVWGQGANDQVATTQASYAASLTSFIAKTQASGMSGRIFVNLESWNVGNTSAAVRAAQASVVGGLVFQGPDSDTLGAASRMPDNTHFNDTGAASFATLMYNAMHASGAPF